MSAIELKDFELLLAIAQTSKLNAAASLLNMNHATAFRRLQHIEKTVGSAMFERHGREYHPTSMGKIYIDVATSIQQKLRELAHIPAMTSPEAMTGHVRITTNQGLLFGYLANWLNTIQKEKPLLNIEIIISTEQLNLNKRDADIAIRICPQPPDHLIGRQIGDVDLAIFAHHQFVQHHQLQVNMPLNDMKALPWIGISPHLLIGSMKRFYDEHHLPSPRITYNNVESVCWGCSQGQGLALLPTILGKKDKQLVQLSSPIPSCSSQLWVLMHPDFKQSIPIYYVYQSLVQYLKKSHAEQCL